jgi:hypothetical protein
LMLLNFALFCLLAVPILSQIVPVLRIYMLYVKLCFTSRKDVAKFFASHYYFKPEPAKDPG